MRRPLKAIELQSHVYGRAADAFHRAVRPSPPVLTATTWTGRPEPAPAPSTWSARKYAASCQGVLTPSSGNLRGSREVKPGPGPFGAIAATVGKTLAGGRSRTDCLPFTKRLLVLSSYTGVNISEAETTTQTFAVLSGVPLPIGLPRVLRVSSRRSSVLMSSQQLKQALRKRSTSALPHLGHLNLKTNAPLTSMTSS